MASNSQVLDKGTAHLGGATNPFSSWTVCIAVIFILGFAAFVRLRLIDLPLERDEGEYAYSGQLLLQGIPPYKLAYNMKLPGTYVAYAAIMAAFGQTDRGIHLGLILINGATILLIYFLGRRLFGTICGLVSAAVYAIYSLSYSVLGTAAHATHFVTLFGLGGALVLHGTLEKKRALLIFWSGILFGLAFLMKQQAVFFGVFGAIVLLWHEWHRRPQERRVFLRCASLFAGMVVPFAVACAALAVAGVFPRFWFWTFSYASQYATITPLEVGWEYLCARLCSIFLAAPIIWIVAVFGLVLLLRRIRKQHNAFFTIALLATTFATACPGLYFRAHYFIPLLAALGLLAGAAIQLMADEIYRRQWNRNWLLIPLALFLAASTDAAVRHRALLFQLSPDAIARAIYPNNPFPEARAVGRYIRDHSTPDSRIAVLGSEPEIYFYSHRRSATGYIYMYALMEPQPYALTMQREMIAEIESTAPDLVVLVGVYTSWLGRKESHLLVSEWLESYPRNHSEQIGFADILPDSGTVYHFGDREGRESQPKSRSFITIFKRTTNPSSLSQ
ncbi:MAG: hypothetical protein QOI04_2382 [Verrucomicrobiota bacterium]|jgi:hypothetical protein